MGERSLPYVWATVFAFRRTPKAKMFFDLVHRIQENYTYYRELFNITNRSYRNDYAFAMADVILNGFTIGTDSIPGPMLNITQAINNISVRGNQIVIKDRERAYVIPKMNMHIMSKQYLQSNNFKEFIDNVTA
jgi:NADH:ubiquinone oxidoreductase subunit 4 (subunit M)